MQMGKRVCVQVREGGEAAPAALAEAQGDLHAWHAGQPPAKVPALYQVRPGCHAVQLGHGCRHA